MKKEDKICGVIYPLKLNNYHLLKQRKKPIYIKFLTHSNSKHPTKLQRGHHILFYLSKGSKLIVGYSEITDVLFKTPFEVRKNYIDKIQMSEEEFDSYTKNREGGIKTIQSHEKYRVSLKVNEDKVYVGNKDHDLTYYLNNWGVLK